MNGSEEHTKRLWRRVRRFFFLLRLAPFVRSIAVCNSVATRSAKATSDIDLFIITAPGRLSTARFFLRLFAHIFGMRAHHDKIVRRFCFSFFVTEKTLNLEPLALEFDPQLAYFVLTMKPIFGLEVFQNFLKANEHWVARYFKRPLVADDSHMQKSFLTTPFRFLLKICASIPGVENFFYHFQLRRDLMHQKRAPKNASIVLQRDLFKFHERDPREKIARRILSLIDVP